MLPYPLPGDKVGMEGPGRGELHTLESQSALQFVTGNQFRLAAVNLRASLREDLAMPAGRFGLLRAKRIPKSLHAFEAFHDR